MNRSETEQLYSISAVDGRYRTKLEKLAPLVSEAALITYRLRVEAEWLLHLSETAAIDFQLSPGAVKTLLNIIKEPEPKGLLRVKELEKTTNHDVKAIEYYLREVLSGENDRTLAFIHFACTSEDINNLSYALMLHEVRAKVLLPEIDGVLNRLETMALQHKNLAMLARTHGQTASPTTLGKEMAVFAHRLRKQRTELVRVELEGKMSGAVGNYNAHLAAYPKLDWVEITRTFIENRLGLKQNLLTTQIENHDSMIALTDAQRRYNTIALGLCRDIWSYISIDYFKQEVKAGEIGSSTMPHKVNPIDFENAEGNFGIANSLATHFADKLLISRWQRDLSDSTVQRTLGTFFGHTVLALQALSKGLDKISPRPDVIRADVDGAWEVLGEAIQTAMRRFGVLDAYERLKAATRGQRVDREDLIRVIDACDALPLDRKNELKALVPSQYTGDANRLVDLYLERRDHANR
ncbi:MAG: adenylosuccinate lyase [Chitinophagaceae bacterium]|nr:adenylosuccinate lyase [Oligoflexus sp.]